VGGKGGVNKILSSRGGERENDGMSEDWGGKLREEGAGKRRREEDAREYTELESEEVCQGSRRGRAVWCEVLEKENKV
jgi:hypothetical protein